MALDDESNWQIIYNGFQLATPENVITAIEIPGVFANHTIRTYATSLVAKPNWWLGGRLIQLLGTSNPDFEASRWLVPLNRKALIRLPILTTQYRLKFEPASWHTEIALIVEQYIGE